MKAGMRRWTLRVGRWVGVLVLATASLAEAQQSSIGGVVTDEATGQTLEAARVLLTGPNRIEATNQEGRYLFRNVAPGSYAVRVLRLGYRPATDTANVAPGEAVTLDFALTGAPVQLDEIVTTATGEQRKLEVGQRRLHHRRGAGGGGGADLRVRQPDFRARGGRAGAEERRHHRHRHPDPDPRIQQPLTLQRAAVLHRRHPDGEQPTLQHASIIGGFGAGRPSDRSLPDQRSQSRRTSSPSRSSRDPPPPPSTGSRPPTGWCGSPPSGASPARPGGISTPSSGRCSDHNTLSGQFLRPGYHTRRPASGLGRLLHHSERAGRPLHPDLGGPVPATERARHRARYKAGLRQQYGVNVSGGNETATYYLSGDYENEDRRLPAAASSKRTRFGTPAATCPTTRSGPTPWSG